MYIVCIFKIVWVWQPFENKGTNEIRTIEKVLFKLNFTTSCKVKLLLRNRNIKFAITVRITFSRCRQFNSLIGDFDQTRDDFNDSKNHLSFGGTIHTVNELCINAWFVSTCYGRAVGSSRFASYSLACRPKSFAFRYPSSHHFTKKLAAGNFFFT